VELKLILKLDDSKILEKIRQEEHSLQPKEIKFWAQPSLGTISTKERGIKVGFPIAYQVDNVYVFAKLQTYFISYENPPEFIYLNGPTIRTTKIEAMLTSKIREFSTLAKQILAGEIKPKEMTFDPTKYFKSASEMETEFKKYIDKDLPAHFRIEENEVDLEFFEEKNPFIKTEMTFSAKKDTIDDSLRTLKDMNKAFRDLKSQALGAIENRTYLYIEVPYYLETENFRLSLSFALPNRDEILITAKTWNEVFTRYKQILPSLIDVYTKRLKLNPNHNSGKRSKVIIDLSADKGLEKLKALMKS